MIENEARPNLSLEEKQEAIGKSPFTIRGHHIRIFVDILKDNVDSAYGFPYYTSGLRFAKKHRAGAEDSRKKVQSGPELPPQYST